MKFSEIQYHRPDPERLKAELGELIRQLKNAGNYEEARLIFLAWEEKQKITKTMSIVSFIRRNMDEDDEFYKEERAFWRSFDAELEGYSKAWAEAMLDSPFRAEFAAEYGDMMLLNAEFDRKTKSPEIVSDLQREAELVEKYEEFEVEEFCFEGKTVGYDEIGELEQDENGARRFAAYKSEGAGWREIAESLDNVFGELVRLRESIGKKMGFDGYIHYEYCRLRRTFTKDDVARFRERVVKYVVPIADAIKRQQARRIGSTYPMPYSDNEFFFKSGNPHPAGDDDYLVSEGQKLFDSLSPEAGEFFRHMTKNEMMFLHAGGGVDLYLPLAESPFIMVDLNGSGDSVRSFMHEAGHTFAYWMNRKRVPVDYVQPSEDITELHSMCMELIALQNAAGFFGEDAQKYTYSLIGESIAFITYGTMIDHFEHSVFEHPEWTFAERRAEWNRLEAIYEPWIKFDGEIPYYGEGMLWQQQGHIIEEPFMYIDYVLTGVVGLEVWAIMQNDPKEAWDLYMALVCQGGTRPFVELIRNAGLHSPFDEDCLKRVSEAAKRWLDCFDITGIE